jgi:hypothetical protein
MRFPKTVVSMAITGLLVVACGGTATPTAGPDGVTPTQNNGAATQNTGTTPTQGGGGALPGNGSGKVNYEISGDKQKVGELPFFGVGSRFGGVGGKYFTFTPADGSSTEIVSIFPDVSSEGSWLVGYVSEEFQVSATACVVTNLQETATSSSGSFDCENALITTTGGTAMQNGRIKGTFEARA